MVPNRKRCRVYFDESKLHDVIKIINNRCRKHIDMRLIVGNCEELECSTVWYVHLDATEYEWRLIMDDLKDVTPVAVIPSETKGA